MVDIHSINSPQKSPDGLGFKTKPKNIIRINKKMVAFAGFLIILALTAILISVAGRRAATDIDTGNGHSNNTLTPAVQAGEQIFQNIPDGDLPARKTQEENTQFVKGFPGLEEPNARNGAIPPLVERSSSNHNSATLRMDSQLSGTQDYSMPTSGKAQHLREEREARLQQALEAGTAVSSSVDGSSSPAPSGLAAVSGQEGTIQQLQALVQRSSGMTNLHQDDGNKQQRKEQFVRDMEAVPERHFVNSTRKAGLSKYEVKAGWIIPATMEHGINSDLPGKITARVSQNVWDSATGHFLMIPQGAQLIGTYDNQVAYGQNRLLVVWRRIIYPDGSSIDLEGMGGVDESGYSGYHDQVNNHYGRIFGFGVLTSLLSTAFQLTQNNKQVAGGEPTQSQIAGTTVSQQLTKLGIELTRKNLQIQPTIEIRPGYQFNVRVDKDLIFSRPYVFGNAQ